MTERRLLEILEWFPEHDGLKGYGRVAAGVLHEQLTDAELGALLHEQLLIYATMQIDQWALTQKGRQVREHLRDPRSLLRMAAEEAESKRWIRG